MLLAHISDLHLDGTDRATDRATRVVTYLNSLTRQPDAVLVTGDIADHGAPEEYAEAARLLAALTAPAFPCPGNHDDRATYRKVLLGDDHPEGAGTATGPINRLHHVTGYALLLCDSTIPGEDAGRFDEETLDWLARTLDDLGDTPALPAFHHPPATVHHPYLDSTNLTNAARFAELLGERPVDNVPAILTGHAHTSMAATFAGRPLLVAPGVISTLRLPWESGEGLVDRVAPPGVAFHVLDEGVRGAGGRITTHYRVVP
ncbi:metallophosphoesterase [Streptomyces sp. NPDC057136]|uniref:metallophosphoesterase n=1 Tax=Streptomyces sp. NPDC057136 TaxID=3346029 RepID=UPI0036450FE2